MTDQSPVDLRTLEPEEPPDMVGPAVRRFRWRVVLFTVVTVIVVSTLAAWVAAKLTSEDSPGFVEARTTQEQAAILDALNGPGICRTPSFTLGGTEVALIEAATLPGGGTSLQFVVHGDKPLTDQRDAPNGDSFARFTTITAAVDGSSVGSVQAQPGADWGEAFMQVPSNAGRPVEMTITGPDLRTHTFAVDLAALGCH